jgi:hypothetical protein
MRNISHYNELNENTMSSPMTSPLLGKKELIAALKGEISRMERDPKIGGVDTAVQMYNWCAGWLNKATSGIDLGTTSNNIDFLSMPGGTIDIKGENRVPNLEVETRTTGFFNKSNTKDPIDKNGLPIKLYSLNFSSEY